MGSIGKAIGGIFGATRDARQINFEPRSFKTQAFTFNPATGTLGRRGGSLARLILRREGEISGSPGFGTQSLFDQFRSQTAGIQEQVAGLRRQIEPLAPFASELLTATLPFRQELGQQFQRFRPGVGAVTKARTGAIRNAAGRAIGNARASFQQRDILGSNFAQQAISAIQRDFGDAEEEALAESFLQEQAIQRDIINQFGNLIGLDRESLRANIGVLTAQLGLSEAQRSLIQQNMSILNQELGFLSQVLGRELAEAGLAAQQISQINGIMANIAAANAKLQVENDINRGESLGAAFDALSGIAGGFSIPSFGGGNSGLGPQFTGTDRRAQGSF